MVVGNGIDYRVTVSRYFIENGIIKTVDNEKLGDLKFINLKIKSSEEVPIFMDFISIDIHSPSSVIEFCNKYGLSGFNKAYKNESLHLDQIIDYDTIPTRSESLLGFTNEVKKMQFVIQLNEFVALYYSEDRFSTSYSEIYNKAIIALQEILIFENDSNLSSTGKSIKYKHKDAISKVDQDVLHEFICTIMLKQINSCLLSIFPQLNLGIDGYERHFLGYWKTPTLLNAMYYELFLKISENKKIRKCQNSTCTRYFEIIGNDTRKIYCCRECASLQAKRNERARKKKEEVQANGKH